MNKITCICLGVRNMEKSIIFYRDKLGFHTNCKENNPRVCFFDTPGTKFELFPLDLLAKDISNDNPPTIGSGFGGITLAYNVDSKEKVNEVIELVRTAGGVIVKEPQEVFWGVYHAYFMDLDGYYWEVAWGQISNMMKMDCLYFKIKQINTNSNLTYKHSYYREVFNEAISC